MLVLRVETDSGEGPYVSSVLRTIVCNLGDENLAYDLRGRHPTPIDDSLYRRNSKAKTGSDYGFTPGEHVFGFEDYRQFRSWFYSDIVLKHCPMTDSNCLFTIVPNRIQSLAILN